MGIRIINAGMLTSVQDLGRLGYQSQGLSVGGAMDARSLKIANLLLNNEPWEAALEFTLLGPELEFTSNAVVSLTGGNFKPQLNGGEAPMYRAFCVGAGDVLKLGGAVSGSRGYLAVAGGFDIPVVLGSRSTNLKAGLGGFRGRALAAGDEIPFRERRASLSFLAYRRVPAEDFSGQEITLRVVMGPQEEAFTPEGIRAFLEGEYEVTAEFDRMGCRLAGPAVETRTTSDILSDGIASGAIQITSQGQPIVLLSDRQTTGGYAKIAAVISVDLPLLAQRKPGHRVRFAAVSVTEAQRLYREELRQLEEWKKLFNQVKPESWSAFAGNRGLQSVHQRKKTPPEVLPGDRKVQMDLAGSGRRSSSAGMRRPGGWRRKNRQKSLRKAGYKMS